MTTLSYSTPRLPIDAVVLEKYRVVRVVGEGGMGAVYELKHEVLGHRVGLKVMHPSLVSNEVLGKRFLHEAQVMSRIHSDHVAAVIDAGQFKAELKNLVPWVPRFEGAPYMLMEFLEGRDLAAVLDERGALPYREAVGYVIEALFAVVQAHASGVVHRDLKPANLFLTNKPDGSRVVKVLDFGVSKLSDAADSGDPRLTSTSTVLGSPAYMSPEQIRQSNKVDARADIWSIGVILYELLTTRFPYPSETMGQLFAAILETIPKPPSTHVEGIPPELDAIVMRCLKREARERWPDVVSLSRALSKFGPDNAAESVSRIARMASSPDLGDSVALSQTLADGSTPEAVRSVSPPPSQPEIEVAPSPVVAKRAAAGRSLAWAVLAGGALIAGGLAVGLARTGPSAAVAPSAIAREPAAPTASPSPLVASGANAATTAPTAASSAPAPGAGAPNIAVVATKTDPAPPRPQTASSAPTRVPSPKPPSTAPANNLFDRN